MRGNVTWYRWMAYITGVVLIVLCVLAVLQPFSSAAAAGVHVVGFVHGMLYLVYLLAGYTLSRRLRLAALPTVMVLLAGTVPVMTFMVERHISRTYIAPALAAEAGAGQAEPPAAAGQVPGAEAVPPSAR